MRHYQVRDVMTAGPMTVTPSTPIKEVASMLVRLQVGALPVVTPRDGVMGTVTETDLLRKEQLQQVPGVDHAEQFPVGVGHQQAAGLVAGHEASRLR
jgi:CBS-domain-containing membrane protein